MDARIFHTLRERMPWIVASRLLRRAGLSTAQGWERTIERNADLQAPAAEHLLVDALREHALCGEKLTKFYTITDRDKQRIIRSIRDISVPDSIFRDNFPFFLSEDALQDASPAAHLVAIQNSDEGIGAVYASKIHVTTREDLPIDDYFDDPQLIRERYDEVVGLRYRPVQLFNIIWVPHHNNFIEIRTDYPKGMPQEFAHQIQSQFRDIANRLVGDAVLHDPTDLFPLIDAMYEHELEGTVVELGFTTSTASVKNEKMRRTQLDLRQELYHRAGKDALDARIEPFRISIRWSFETDEQIYQPELSLVGTSRGRHTLANATRGPLVSGAMIKNCIGNVDYEHVKDRMCSHLTSLSEQAAA